MVAMSVFLVVVAGVFACHLFGMRMMEITRTKLNTSRDARKTLNLLISEVRAAKVVLIGTGTLTTFAEVGNNLTQSGNGIQICLTTNTNTFIRYFVDNSSKSLKRVTNGSSLATTVATSITNTIAFAAEDYSGKRLTNEQNNCVVDVTLQFSRLENATVPMGSTNYFKSYQLKTKISRRTLD